MGRSQGYLEGAGEERETRLDFKGLGIEFKVSCSNLFMSRANKNVTVQEDTTGSTLLEKDSLDETTETVAAGVSQRKT